jgi:glutamate N-acetyltransferase/amino-acid N-acetyltransferase
MITVDGDTSTNDMVIVLANGMAENKEITSKEDPNYKIFIDHLFELMSHLAKLIVSDGEGSSKFITYEVNGASTEKEAAILARSIASSTLVKTAMFGRDPNWGRIVCAAGNAGIEFEYDSIDLYLGSESKQIKVLTNGTPESFDRNYMKKLLRESHLKIIMDLKKGKKSASAWGSDLTTDYVLFNSVYTT